MISLASTYIYADLVKNGLDPVNVDQDLSFLLKYAEVCYYLELSAMVRDTENVLGVVSQEIMGESSKRFENGMPMFFFASGASDGFMDLLSHETWRMRGHLLTKAYIKSHFAKTTGYLRAPPSVMDGD